MNAPPLMLTHHVSLRNLIVIGVAVCALGLLAGYLYVLKKPFAALSMHEAALRELQTAYQPDPTLLERIADTQAAVDALDKTLFGHTADLAENELVAHVVGKLDEIAHQHAVQLVGVEPGAIGRILEFDEIPFHVEAAGDYFRLIDWLNAAEQALGPMRITAFEIIAGASGKRRLHFTLVAYRHVEGRT